MTKQSKSTDLYGYPTFTQVPDSTSRPNAGESALDKSERLNAGTQALPTTLARLNYLMDNGLSITGFDQDNGDLTLRDEDGNTYWLDLAEGWLV